MFVVLFVVVVALDLWLFAFGFVYVGRLFSLMLLVVLGWIGLHVGLVYVCWLMLFDV